MTTDLLDSFGTRVEAAEHRSRAQPAEPRTKAIHYAGALRLRSGTNGVCDIGAGFAACCWGRRAQKIRDNGNHTLKRDWVTCKVCLRRMAMELPR